MRSAKPVRNDIHILMFGKTGQLATELQTLAAKAGYRVTALGREQVTLEDSAAVSGAIIAHDADIIVNAAAYTNVDGAEIAQAEALAVNADAVLAMAEAARLQETPFIHVSTDYVFNGTGETPWKTADPIDPINSYGASKAKGEALIASVAGRNIIIRTSWIFSPHGNNFLKTMLRLAAQQEELRIVGDQVGGPTSAADLASAILTIAEKELAQTGAFSALYDTRILHFTGFPYVSWAQFAEEIIASAGLKNTVTSIPSSDFPTPAARPKNSRLDLSDITHIYGIEAPDWRKAIHDCIKKVSK